jgi:hypothetical protein
VTKPSPDKWDVTLYAKGEVGRRNPVGTLTFNVNGATVVLTLDRDTPTNTIRVEGESACYMMEHIFKSLTSKIQMGVVDGEAETEVRDKSGS